jgi:hypothetical protein
VNIANVNAFLCGAIWICCWVAALFFLRFWRASRDRFFVFLTVAFGLLGLQWLSVGLFTWDTNSRHEPFILRVLAFVIILLGIVDKNRRAAVTSVRPVVEERNE